MYFNGPNSLLGLLLTLCFITQAASIPVSYQEPLSSDYEVQFRDAVASDLDDIVTIVFDAFAPGDAFKYTTPGYEQYKDYAKYCAREEIKRKWDDIAWKDMIVKVITVSDDHASNLRKNRAVATAVWMPKRKMNDRDGEVLVESIWDVMYDQQAVSLPANRNSPPYDCSLHLGANATRMEDFMRQLKQAKKDNIDSQFTNHLHLTVLATHPTWDGHNFAAMNLHWGMQFAKVQGIPITLMATPEGYPLYDGLGFQSLKNVTIQKLDGEGELWYEAMVLKSQR